MATIPSTALKNAAIRNSTPAKVTTPEARVDTLSSSFSGGEARPTATPEPRFRHQSYPSGRRNRGPGEGASEGRRSRGAPRVASRLVSAATSPGGELVAVHGQRVDDHGVEYEADHRPRRVVLEVRQLDDR